MRQADNTHLGVVMIGNGADELIHQFAEFCETRKVTCYLLTEMEQWECGCYVNQRTASFTGTNISKDISFDLSEIGGLWFRNVPTAQSFNDEKENEYALSEINAFWNGVLGLCPLPVLNRPTASNYNIASWGNFLVRNAVRSKTNLRVANDRIFYSSRLDALEAKTHTCLNLQKGTLNDDTRSQGFDLSVILHEPAGNKIAALHIGQDVTFFYLDGMQIGGFLNEELPSSSIGDVKRLNRVLGECFGISYYVLGNDELTFLGFSNNPSFDLISKVSSFVFEQVLSFFRNSLDVINGTAFPLDNNDKVI